MEPNQNRTPIIFAVGFAVVVLGGAITYVTQRDTSKNTVSQSSSTPTPSSSTSTSPVPTTTTTPARTLKFSITEPGKLILPGGFADPTVVPTSSGYRLYVNTFGKGPSGYLAYTSKDGISWTKETDIIISGVATGRAIVLPTGIRFYYPGTQPINPSDPPADMFSTFSTDGLKFTKDPGVILKPRDGYYVEGPTVFQLPDKTWRMYFNENSIAAGNQRDGAIWGASSADGITWTRDEALTLEDTTTGQPWRQALHPFVISYPEGGYIMFYNTHSEVYAATSNDGLTWAKQGKVGVHGADVDGFFQADGSFRMYYGDYSEKDGGLVYTAVVSIK